MPFSEPLPGMHGSLQAFTWNVWLSPSPYLECMPFSESLPGMYAILSALICNAWQSLSPYLECMAVSQAAAMVDYDRW